MWLNEKSEWKFRLQSDWPHTSGRFIWTMSTMCKIKIDEKLSQKIIRPKVIDYFFFPEFQIKTSIEVDSFFIFSLSDFSNNAAICMQFHSQSLSITVSKFQWKYSILKMLSLFYAMAKKKKIVLFVWKNFDLTVPNSFLFMIFFFPFPINCINTKLALKLQTKTKSI